MMTQGPRDTKLPNHPGPKPTGERVLESSRRLHPRKPGVTCLISRSLGLLRMPSRSVAFMMREVGFWGLGRSQENQGHHPGQTSTNWGGIYSTITRVYLGDEKQPSYLGIIRSHY